MSAGAIVYVAPEWAPISPGGIGRAIYSRAMTDERAIILLDRSLSDVARARRGESDHIEIVSVAECAGPAKFTHAFKSEAYARSYQIWQALISLCSRADVSSVEFVDFDGPGYVSIKAKRLGIGPALPKLSVRLHGTMKRTAEGDFDPLLPLEAKQRAQMERYALEFAERIIAPSEAVFEEYAIDGGWERHEVVIDPPVVPNPSPSPGAYSADLEPPFKIGFLGKVQPLKGPLTLVEAAIRLMDSFLETDFEIHIVGSDQKGRYRESHEEELRRLIPAAYQSRFVFHGHRPVHEAHRLLARCHAAALPSRTETFGLAAHEVAMLGIPLIVTELAAFRSGLARSESVVEYIQVDDSEALSELLGEWVDLWKAGSWPPRPREGGGESLPGRRLERIPDPRENDESVGTLAESFESPSREVPLVSVVIPFFEMHDYLEACLDSLGADTYPNVEWVIVDDGSISDESHAILDRLERSFKLEGRHRVVRQRNRGLGAARNVGVRMARGEFVLPLDPDDLVVPGYVSAAMTALQRAPELTYVTSISGLFDDGKSPEDPSDWIIPYDPTPGMLMYENGAGTAAGIFRRSVLIDFPYREDLRAYEDWDLYLRLSLAGRKGEVLPMVGHRYRQRADGMARHAHAIHDKIVAEVVMPHVARLDAEIASAIEIYIASESRLRGLSRRRRPAVVQATAWLERVYRRRLKDWLRTRLGEDRRDAIVRFVRRVLLKMR